MGDHRLSIRLLGGFAVAADGRDVPEAAWRQRRAATLIKLLALAPDHRLLAEQLIDVLWPALAAAAGAANLRKAAHDLRRATGLDHAVARSGELVVLLPDGEVDTDVGRFEAAADAALAGGEVDACRTAAGLYAGELLPEDRYADWTEPHRAHLRRRQLELLAAGRMWHRLVEEDPTDERAHREIMAAELAAGHRAAALRQYEHLVVTLRDELGVDPGEETVALYEEALAMGQRVAATPEERARALLAWGVVHWDRAELDEAERAAQDARALASDAGLAEVLGEASELLGLVTYAQGRWREMFADMVVDALRHAPSLVPFVFDANMCMSEFALGELDGVTSVADLAADLLDVATDNGSDQARALGMLLRGEAALMARTDLAGARRDLREAARLHRRAGSTTGVALATWRLAEVEAAAADVQSAGLLLEEAMALARSSRVPAHLLPCVYGGMLQVATAEGAMRVLDAADADLAGARPCDPCSMTMHVEATRRCAAAGQLDRARWHCGESQRIAGMWRDGPWHAATAEARAVLHLAEGGDPAAAVALLRTAAEGFTRAARPADAARCAAAAASLA